MRGSTGTQGRVCYELFGLGTEVCFWSGYTNEALRRRIRSAVPSGTDWEHNAVCKRAGSSEELRCPSLLGVRSGCSLLLPEAGGCVSATGEYALLTSASRSCPAMCVCSGPAAQVYLNISFRSHQESHQESHQRKSHQESHQESHQDDQTLKSTSLARREAPALA